MANGNRNISFDSVFLCWWFAGEGSTFRISPSKFKNPISPANMENPTWKKAFSPQNAAIGHLTQTIPLYRAKQTSNTVAYRPFQLAEMKLRQIKEGQAEYQQAHLICSGRNLWQRGKNRAKIYHSLKSTSECSENTQQYCGKMFGENSKQKRSEGGFEWKICFSYSSIYQRFFLVVIAEVAANISRTCWGNSRWWKENYFKDLKLIGTKYAFRTLRHHLLVTLTVLILLILLMITTKDKSH